MAQELEPVEFKDSSGGQNSNDNQTVIGQNELSISQNIRLPGKGRIRRRWGAKQLGSPMIPLITSNFSSTLSEVDRLGRIIIPYLCQVNETNKRSEINPVFVLGNEVKQFVGGSNIAVETGLNNGEKTYLSWRPRYSQGISYEKFPNVGAGFLDGMIYLGTSLEYGTELIGGALINKFFRAPIGVAMNVTDHNLFNVGDIIVGGTSGAQATLKYNPVDGTNLYDMYLYNWNGIDFIVDEDLKVNDVVVTTFDPRSDYDGNGKEFMSAGLILDWNSTAKRWTSRKWGISAPPDTITGIESGSGSVIAGTFLVKYTLLRYIGGGLSGAAANDKLSGGELISESAPSPEASIVITGTNVGIAYSAWDVPVDPQVTHVRFYRTDGFSTEFKHVADVGINDTNPVIDTYSELEVQSEAVLCLTDGYKTFGEDGENSGYCIELAERRVFVGGNKDFPQRLYFSAPDTGHQHSEYFYSSLDLTEVPGESITAIKWWKDTLFVFTERSVYTISPKVVQTSQDQGVEVETFSLKVTGLGCAMRNGIKDMGGYLIVMTESGLRRFDGVQFDAVPLTLRVNDILGTDLLNAQMTASDDYIYIITETSRAANKIITIKYSDGTYACGIDVLDSSIELTDCMGYVPNLKNFGNLVDDSNFIYNLSRHYEVIDDEPLMIYYLSEYDLSGRNYDMYMGINGATNDKAIIAQFSPGIIDFGALNVAAIKRISAYISSLGDSNTTYESPSGKFLVKLLGNYAPNGTAESYDEAVLQDLLSKNKALSLAAGDPLQGKPTKVFDGTYKHQTGGNMSMNGYNAAIATTIKQLFQADFPLDSWMRLWKIIFDYRSVNNFEFNGFGIIFVKKESPL